MIVQGSPGDNIAQIGILENTKRMLRKINI